MPTEIPLVVPNDCLAVFADDTGHEALLKDQPVYGLGGCAAMARDLDRLIRTPWREVRRRIAGSPDTPLHASEFVALGYATPENIEIINEFFRHNAFARLGAIISFKTALVGALGSVPTIAKVLQNRIRDVASRTACGSVAVIFEASGRADRLIEHAFQDFGLEEAGKPIPFDCYFMRKQIGDPALEVADFVVHTVGRQARHSLIKRGDFVPDFCEIFHSVDRALTSYMEIDSVVPTDVGHAEQS
jgi:hypothetical protein